MVEFVEDFPMSKYISGYVCYYYLKNYARSLACRYSVEREMKKEDDHGEFRKTGFSGKFS